MFRTKYLNIEDISTVRKYLLKKDIFFIIYFLIMPIFTFSLYIYSALALIGTILMIYFFKKGYRLGITSKIESYYESNNSIDVLYILNLSMKILGIKFLYHLNFGGTFRYKILILYYILALIRDNFIVDKF